MVVMTNFVLLIGSGLFSQAVLSFQTNAFDDMYVYALPYTHGNALYVC